MPRTPYLALPYALALGQALHHQGREYRVAKVKQREQRWLVWLTPTPFPAGNEPIHPRR